MALMVSGLSGEVLAKSEGSSEQCLKCHQAVWDAALAMKYVHKPFLEKKCKHCHIEDEKMVERARVFMTDSAVDWLGSRRMNALSHWFKVSSSALVNQTIIIDCLLSGQGVIRKKITCPLCDDIPEIQDDGKPPTITGVRVTNIERGLFLAATIEWDTDEISSSQIFCGTKKLNIKSRNNANMTTKHTVVIAGLKTRKKYKFKVISTDLFGHTSKSALYSFSTHKSSKRKKSSAETPKWPKQLEISSELFRNEDQLMVKITTNRPVMVALGTPKLRDVIRNSTVSTGTVPENHNLKDALMTNNKVCEPCHGKYTKKRNHPINVPIKAGMKLPEDYFVLRNGNITCMTCHTAHGSNFENRLVRSSKRELCIGCHVAKM